MNISRLGRSVKRALIATTLLASSNAYAVIVPADILWLIDVSASMGNDINQIRTRIGEFETAMNDNGIDANYGLVEFGGNVDGAGNDWQTVTDMTSNFATFTAGLNSIGATHGNPEDGTSAGLFGLNNISWNSGHVQNLILVTDEDDDSDGNISFTATCQGGSRANCKAFDDELTAQNALFNVIRQPLAGNTTNTYDYLAAEHGGTAFSIALFRSNPDDFFTNFINTKVKEIKDSVPAIPVPAAFWLFGTALVGLIGFGKRRKAA